MKHILLLFVFVLVNQLFSQDHSEFMEDPFGSPQEVTETCLGCHEVGEEIMKTHHWTWKDRLKREDGSRVNIGKSYMINNFCISVTSNWPRCTSCHIGYGWKDKSFDFSDENNIDCLICHDQSGTYKKVPTGAGMPAKDVDLLKAAQSVGPTTRANCGVCHFDGGGGTGVKHGDMDNSLYEPDEEIDVHMGGMDFNCTECHKTEGHKIAGAGHTSMALGKSRLTCEECHEGDIHKLGVLNRHVDAVACETCHIPAFARAEPTKVWWDWSTAGKDSADIKDEFGKSTFNKKKGSFVWAKNVTPTYAWFNGQADYYAAGDKFNPDEVLKLNSPRGDVSDAKAKIYPFKVMKGKQPYDTGHGYLITPKLFGKDGFWKTFDWNKAAELGMKTSGLEYSGSYDFVETEMYWPIHHMVAPADQAIKCMTCHGRNGKLLDWQALGYTGDPVKTRGRKTTGLLK